MEEKNLYIGYDAESDELIISSNPKAPTVGYFIDGGVAVQLNSKTMKPQGLSFILLKEYFQKHKRTPFAKVPLRGHVRLPQSLQKLLPEKTGSYNRMMK
ncbi:MAG: hypothetical protein A3H42_00015 [Deltaproteobacteria bacterium RIFCSPLOWO2_02_FULL_46_8]|nr:MAG: hypothetical protein A3H42_00015 [Deltaproteobacteria bacterium RIFCSPLOWO2_02_FULL_46_8]